MCITPSIINLLFQDVCYVKNFITKIFSLFVTEEIFSISVFYVCDMQICSSPHLVFTLVLSHKIPREGLWFSLLKFFANKVIRINRQRQEQMATDRNAAKTRWDG